MMNGNERETAREELVNAAALLMVSSAKDLLDAALTLVDTTLPFHQRIGRTADAIDRAQTRAIALIETIKSAAT